MRAPKRLQPLRVNLPASAGRSFSELLRTVSVLEAGTALWAPSLGGGFNGWWQHFILRMRWSVSDEAAAADLLLGSAEIGDLGSMATRGVDEFNRSRI